MKHECLRDTPPLNWTHEVACKIHQLDTPEKCPEHCPYKKRKAVNEDKR